MRRRGKASVGKVVMVVAVVIIIAAILTLLFLKCGKPVLSGLWVDRDSRDYYVEFLSDGTYKESTFEIPMPFHVTKSQAVFECIDGTQVSSDIMYNFGKTLAVVLNGEYHLLEQAPRGSKFKGTGTTPGTIDEAYKLSQEWEGSPELKLYDNNVFEFTGAYPYTGKYTKCADSILLYSEDRGFERYKSWDLGYVTGRVSATLEREVTKSNAIEERGIQLRGAVSIPEIQTTYTFDSNNFVVRETSTGERTEFVYFADMTGLITMSDTVGQSIKDYLWMDPENGDIYRYVFKRDSWIEYIKGMGA